MCVCEVCVAKYTKPTFFLISHNTNLIAKYTWSIQKEQPNKKEQHETYLDLKWS
jgi:hypothetical protein